MNLIYGELMDRTQSLEALGTIGESVCRTLTTGGLPVKKVVDACEALSGEMNEEDHVPALMARGMTKQKACDELRLAKAMLRREYLETRLKHEFYELPGGRDTFVPYGGASRVVQLWKPLGVLLHIAAGNVEALPAFSVIEGLLTGNINILKLPGMDDGLSTGLLRKLMQIEPLIRDYVYVFDYPSEDVESIKKMTNVADAVVVWGSDAAISAVRRMVKPDTRIIEWGHRISFAYVSGDSIRDEALEGIAHNICETEQLFCSACQGIYLDTDDMDAVFCFAERFISVLNDVAASQARELPAVLQAQKTIELYTEKLESVSADKRVYRAAGCSVIASSDSRPETSYMFRNCWIKPLPKERLISTLLPCKNHLQTVALICTKTRRAELEALLLATGVVRLTDGQNMSQDYCGMPHDGEFALRRYMKRVSIEYADVF